METVARAGELVLTMHADELPLEAPVHPGYYVGAGAVAIGTLWAAGVVIRRLWAARERRQARRRAEEAGRREEDDAWPDDRAIDAVLDSQEHTDLATWMRELAVPQEGAG